MKANVSIWNFYLYFNCAQRSMKSIELWKTQILLTKLMLKVVSISLIFLMLMCESKSLNGCKIYYTKMLRLLVSPIRFYVDFNVSSVLGRTSRRNVYARAKRYGAGNPSLCPFFSSWGSFDSGLSVLRRKSTAPTLIRSETITRADKVRRKRLL